MKISIIDPLQVSEETIEKNRKILEGKGHQLQVFDQSAGSDEEIIERLKDSDVAIITNKPFSGEVIRNTNLKLLDVAFTGFDHVDMKACKQKGLVVENASGYSNDSVAELAIGLMLALLRKFPENHENIFDKGQNPLLGETLKAKKVGIVGTGKIGLASLKLLKAFGCKLFASSRHEKDEAKELGVKYLPLDELFKTCDIISIHLALNDDTRGYIGKEQLELMKEGAILINCARGPIVDNAYLARLLNEGKIKAGIDVFDMEPPLPEDYPLRNAKNCILTNHVAFLTKEAMEIRADIVFDNLYSFLDGKIVNQVG